MSVGALQLSIFGGRKTDVVRELAVAAVPEDTAEDRGPVLTVTHKPNTTKLSKDSNRLLGTPGGLGPATMRCAFDAEFRHLPLYHSGINA